MREQLKALSKETLIYGASTVVGRFLNFLLVPFYVNVLHSAAEYGVSTSLYTYMSFFNIIYTLGLESAYFRYAAKGEGETRSLEEEKRLFSTPFLFILLFGGILTAVVLITAPALVYPVFHDPKTDITQMVPMLTRILRYGGLIILFDSLNVLPFAALRLDHRAKWFATIRLLNIVITLVLNFLFIMGFHWGVEGIFLANLAASAMMMLMLMPTVIRRFHLKLAKPVMQKMMPFGLTNVPAYLSAMMVQVIDRPIVQAYLGLAILGVYQANYRMGFTMMVFVSLFEYAWRPFFLRQAQTDDKRARQLFSRVFTYFMLIALVGFITLAFLLPYVVSEPIPFLHRTLLRKDYLTGLDIIPVILAAYIFQGMYTNFIAGIYIKEHNKVLPFVTGLGAAVNVITLVLMIPVNGAIGGMMGAALSTLFAYMAMAAALYWQAQKVYPIPYDWRRVGTLFLVVGLTYAIERFITLENFVSHGGIMFLIRIGLLAAMAGTLFISGFFSRGEIAALRSMIRIPGGSRTRRDQERITSPDPIEVSQERREDR